MIDITLFYVILKKRFTQKLISFFNYCIMNSVQRTGVYAFYLSLSVFTSSCALYAKESKDGISANSTTTVATNNSNNRATANVLATEFQWADHNVLSWEDFRGSVNAASNESAAATHCGIGFKTSRPADGGKPRIIVYNTFYVNKSWVKADAKIPEILTHEQGHFDLCELYTRKLRQQMEAVNMDMPDLRSVLEHLYFDVKNEYESRQQAYEDETIHGTNFAQQSKWHDIISKELSAHVNTGSLASSAH